MVNVNGRQRASSSWSWEKARPPPFTLPSRSFAQIGGAAWWRMRAALISSPTLCNCDWKRSVLRLELSYLDDTHSIDPTRCFQSGEKHFLDYVFFQPLRHTSSRHHLQGEANADSSRSCGHIRRLMWCVAVMMRLGCNGNGKYSLKESEVMDIVPYWGWKAASVQPVLNAAGRDTWAGVTVSRMLRRRIAYVDPSSGKDILGNRSLCFIFICAFGLVTLLQQILYGKNYIKR